MQSSRLNTLILGLGFALLTACTEANRGREQPATLGDVEVPSDFTFATTKPVALTVSATEEVIGGTQGALAVERTDGKVLFRGPIQAAKPLAVKLTIPSKDDALRVRLYGQAGERSSAVPVESGAAAHRFE